MTSPFYVCGHLRSEENSIGRKIPRCRACYRAKAARERENNARSKLGVQPITSDRRDRMVHSKLIAEPAVSISILDSVTPIERGSRALLRAIYASHPQVFDAAERDGRQVVRP